MKLNGVKPVHNIKTLVLPRQGGEPLVFECAAIQSMDEFEKLCPDPIAPKKVIKGGAKVPDFEDKGYITAVAQQGEKRWDYIVLASLRATKGLEWETVNMNDPSTWHLWRKEMGESGLSAFEINRIVATVVDANSLSEESLEAARSAFLAAREQV